MRSQRRTFHRGQVTFEFTLVIAAMTAAIMVMRPYITRAMNAFAKATERELNGATEENRP